MQALVRAAPDACRPSFQVVSAPGAFASRSRSSSSRRASSSRAAASSRQRWTPLGRPPAAGRRVVAAAANGGGGEDGSGGDDEQQRLAKGGGGGGDGRYSKMVEELQSLGMTPAKAKDTLRVWADLGARDPEQLKQLLVKRSMQPLTALAVQSLLDFVACGGGFYIGKISGSADFPGSLLISLLGYFFGCYYLLQAGFQVTTLATLGAAARRYSTDATVLLEAVRQLAGPASGLSVVDSASLVVNTLKIIQTLEKIGEQLKDYSPSGAAGSLANLSAYLALQRAEEVYGFEPGRYGLTEAQAADIAGVFASFDANDDGRLEQSELRTLCDRLGSPISDAEAKEAVKLLDAKQTGFIQFDDFVEWWLGNRPSREAKEAAARSQ